MSRLLNDRYCVGWAVKLYSLTQFCASLNPTSSTGQRLHDWFVNLALCVSSHALYIRDLRSFVIRFDFESYVRFEIRFVVTVRFEIFESSALSIVIRKETIGGV